MPDKKYDFVKILSEYNKKCRYKCTISSNILNPVVIIQTGLSPHIVYRLEGSSTVLNASLPDFAYCNIDREINFSRIIAIINAKETDKLNLQLKILPSNKIRYAYLKTNYFSSAGPLGSSCMRYKEMQKALNFYVKNNVKIVVIIDNNNKIHARALLWENVKSTKLKKPFTYLDRMFFNSDGFISQFRDLAKENKWKAYKSTSAGGGESDYYIDDINITGICHLPYTDTFRYLFYNDNVLSADTSDGIINKLKYRDDRVSLTHTSEGGYQPAIDPDRVKEAFTGNYISKKDAIKIKRYDKHPKKYDGYVLKKNIANISGAYYSKHDNDITKSELDGFILKENSVSEAFTNDTIDKSKAIHSPKYNGYVHKANTVCIKCELYHKKDTDVVQLNGKWYHISQCFRNYNREKRNTELAGKGYHFWIGNEVFVPYPTNSITAEDNLIPKEQAVIMYNLVYNPILNSIEHQEVYCIDNRSFIQLITGELIKDSFKNRQYLKKFNNKWYIKQEFRLNDTTIVPKSTPATFHKPNKNQLTLF